MYDVLQKILLRTAKLESSVRNPRPWRQLRLQCCQLCPPEPRVSPGWPSASPTSGFASAQAAPCRCDSSSPLCLLYVICDLKVLPFWLPKSRPINALIHDYSKHWKWPCLGVHLFLHYLWTSKLHNWLVSSHIWIHPDNLKPPCCITM
jgi:hypothetical protein